MSFLEFRYFGVGSRPAGRGTAVCIGGAKACAECAALPLLHCALCTSPHEPRHVEAAERRNTESAITYPSHRVRMQSIRSSLLWSICTSGELSTAT